MHGSRRSVLQGLGGLALAGCRMDRSRAPHDRSVRAQALDAALAGFVTRGEVPGIVAAVHSERGLELRTYGTTAAGGSVPMRRDTIFRISSMSKPVTAVATLMLVEDGTLALDEPIDRLLPELARRRVLRSLDAQLDDTVPAERAITVLDLLTFRMGMGIVLAPPGTYPIQRALDELQLGQGMPQPSIPPAPDEWIRRLGTLPLMDQPGHAWMYNTGADVLGVLLARASGRSFEAFLRERLFGPLGMKDTGFSVPASELPRFATSYVVDPQGGLAQLDAPDGQWSCPPAFPSGAGGMVSTVDDYLAFAQLLRDRGRHDGRQLLSAESIDRLATDQLTPAQKAATQWVGDYFDDHGWGLGVAVLREADELGRSAGSFGWDGGLGTSSYVDPSAGLVGVLLTQRAWTSPEPPAVTRAFWRAVYESIV